MSKVEELPDHLQRRNSLVFLINNSLAYLVAPVFYVGVLHAAILSSLGTSDTFANLPESVYLWVAPVPLLIAWFWRSPAQMPQMLVGALTLMGAAGLAVSVSFIAAPKSTLVTALVVHAGIIGIGNGVRQMCLWELIGRGLSPERRGRTLGWAFGLGPVFAVIGSMASQLVLKGDFMELVYVPRIRQPWNYVVLFGATCPAMWLSAVMVRWIRLPPVEKPAERARAADVIVGLRLYFLQPLILVAAIAFLLTYGGTMIMNNLSLYAREAIGESPEKYAGLQLALRFGFKCVAGFSLGWLVTRVHAKASLLATTTTCLLGVLWGLLAPGKLYLLSFGLLGAGELFYVYYMNFIVSCSAPDRIRENTAYTNLLTVSLGFVPLLFGAVSDGYGLKASFWVAIGMFALALAIVSFALPKQPT